MQNDKIQVAYRRNPFSLGHVDRVVAEGSTVAQMISEIGLAPIAEVHDGVFVYVGDELVERARWDDVKLVRGSIVSVGITPAGGGGGGQKNPTRTIALLAVMVIAIAASYYFPPAMGLAAGSAEALLAGAAAGAAVSMAGSMLVNALIPLSTPKPKGENEGPSYLSGMSNRLDPYGAVPRIFGKNRVYPRYAALPYTELVGTDEQYLRCLFCIGKGKYSLSNFKIGDTALSTFSNVEMEQYFTGDSTVYRLFPNDPAETALTIELEQNIAQTRTTGTNVDEIAVEVTLPQGLYGIRSNGNRRSTTASVKVEYSVKDAGVWREMTGFRRLSFSGSPSSNIAIGQTVVGPSGQGTIRYANYYSYMGDENLNTDGDGRPIYEIINIVDYIDIDVTSGSFSVGQSVTVAGAYSATIATVTVMDFEITGEYGSPIKKSVSTKVARGQYDVRVTKTSGESTDTEIKDVYWTTLRTITYQTPVTLTNCTLVALRIRATGQLNGMLDQFNCTAEALLNAYDGSSWNLVKSRNPAWAFSEVLCGSSNKRPVATTRLDLTALRTFATHCETSGFNFDAIVDYKTTAWELLRQICATGRATPGMTDNKYTVIEDLVQTTPVQHFGPRNSWNFSGSRVFPDIPHALRIRFPNEDKDYVEDECVVYDDGYTSVNATLYETLEFFGVTDYDHVWKLGRYHLAVMRLRPETYTFDCDVEHMVCTRGNLVRITHDVLMVGIASARIKTISTTAISVDDVISMEAGKTYGFQFRRADGTFKTCTITTAAGEKLAGTVLTINPAMASGDLPEVGDLCFFGEAASVSINIIVSRIEPGPDLTARVTCVPYNAAICTAGAGTIPTWQSNITLPPVVNRTPPKPKIIAATYIYRTQNINADGTYDLVMSVGFDVQASGLVQSGTTDPAFQPPDVTQGFNAEYSEDDGNWIPVPTIGREARSFEFPAKNGVSYDIRIRSYSIPGVFSDWDTLSNVTTNYIAAVPGNVSGLALIGGGTSFLTRDLEVTWTAVPGGGDTGSTVIDYKVEVKTSDGNTSLRTEYVTQNKYLYDFDKNLADGGPRASVQIKVQARNRFAALSVTPASVVFTNPVPGNPGSLASFAPMGSVEFYWAANTEADFSHFSYRVKISSGSWGSWVRTTSPRFVRTLTQAEKDSYGADATIYFEVKAVDAFGQESGSTAINASAGSLNIKSTDIAAFAITASKIFTKIPVIEGLSLTNNSPASGRVAWSACSLYYNGVLYSISEGNTSLSTHKFIYWKDLASTFTTSIAHPADLADWKPGEDFVIAVNISGVGQEAWNAIANQVIGSAYIMNAAIQDAHVSSLSGTKISASTSVAIGPTTTFGADGIQMEYNSGNPRFYAGDGSNSFITFDGTNVTVRGKIIAESGSDINGPNTCPNAAFEAGSFGWTYTADSLATTQGYDYAGYCLDVESGKGTTPWVFQNNRYGDSSKYAGYVSKKIPVSSGKMYCVSCYTGAVNCKVVVYAYFYTSGDVGISGTEMASTGKNDNSVVNGTTLDSFKRCYDFGVAPANAAYARIAILKYDTIAGQTASWMFFTRAALQEIGIFQTTPPPWAPCDTSIISGGYIRTELLSATNIQTGILTADVINTGALNYTKLAVGAATVNAYGTGTTSASAAVTRVGSDSILIIARAVGMAGSIAGGESGVRSPGVCTLNIYRGTSGGTLLATASVEGLHQYVQPMTSFIDTPGGTGSQTYTVTTGGANCRIDVVNLRR